MYYDPEEVGCPATVHDAMREFAMNAGLEYPDRAWLLTDYDVWVPNPYYHGPAVPHPEEYRD